MKEKSPQEQTAAARQVELLTKALNGASADGYWFNVKGRMTPRVYSHPGQVSPFNAIIFALHADANDYPTAIYTSFQDSRNRNQAVMKGELACPMNWYRWATYVNRANPDDIISREYYESLPKPQQDSYKGVRKREIRPMFNLSQTTMPLADSAEFERLTQQYGGIADRGNIKSEERQARQAVNGFIEKMKDSLVPVRKSVNGEDFYNAEKDVVYMRDQGSFSDYPAYVQELMRNMVTATGSRERLAREGAMVPGGKTVPERTANYERLIGELASAYKMMELGMPARLSPESLKCVEAWTDELKENPCMIDAIEADVNNALDVIRKAERGEKLEFASKRIANETDQYRKTNRPQVSEPERLILQDIIRQGGMNIDVRNFPGATDAEKEANKKAFMEKFTNLDYYEGQMLFGIGQAEKYGSKEHFDAELLPVAWTKALGEAARIQDKCNKWLPKEWEQKGLHFIADEMMCIPDKRSREFVVVKDKATGIYDVILPTSARSGGDVVMPNGDKRNFWLTPDEVMTKEERKATGATVVSNTVPGFNKEKIAAALMAEGATYVRFFNKEGNLRYRPDDAFFKDKTVHAAKLNNKSVDITATFDVKDAVSRATEVEFDRMQMLKDDNGKWALLLKPKDEPSFAVYPELADLNRFFSVIKQGDNEASTAVRNELAQKYYAMVTANPNSKVNVFGTWPDGVDPRQIQRVNIFRTKDDKIMCAAKIDGRQKDLVKEITTDQWSRMWVCDDVAQYKNILAANLFADVLRQQAVDAKADQSVAQEKVEVQPDLVVNLPNLEQYANQKQKHPDAVLLFRVDDDYQAIKEDSAHVAEILGLKEQTVNGITMTRFPTMQLEGNLPKLVRAGCRIAICEQLEAKQAEAPRVERGCVQSEKQEATASLASESTAQYHARR